MTCLQVVADIEAKYRVKMAASSGRLEDAMDAVTLHDGRRRPSRRSNYEILLKVCPPAQLPSPLPLWQHVTQAQRGWPVTSTFMCQDWLLCLEMLQTDAEARSQRRLLTLLSSKDACRCRTSCWSW